MRRVRHYQNMANHLEELDKMTISAVNGYAVGGSLEITMACDFLAPALSDSPERATSGGSAVPWPATSGPISVRQIL
jgi:enoyl-CoA hydratase